MRDGAGSGRSKVRVEVEGRSLALSNLSKVLYPETGFTKGEVIDYYRQVASAVLPHLADRPLTRKRWPDGVQSQPFFEKNAPRGVPDWVRTVLIPEHGDEGVEYVIAQDLPTLVWLANLAALELHVPQWTVGPRGGIKDADLMVFDLDPGPPATIVECCRVALRLKEHLENDGLTAVAKTSGNKGAQLYVPVVPTSSERTSAYARSLAQLLEHADRELVVARMDKRLRQGKVFIDWSQNNAAKTTVAPYSLRGTGEPRVSTPVTWSEVEACRRPADLAFGPDDVVRRLDEHGDLFADLEAEAARLPKPAGVTDE